MIISDGTTSLTFTDSFGNPDNALEVSTKTTAGGKFRVQVGGERYSVSEDAVMTGTQYASLMTLLKNGSNSYFYTPSVVPPEYSSTDFPMSVRILTPEKTQKAYNGSAIVYYITMEITSIEYI